MVFSSNIFLFLFLPVFLAIYFLLPLRCRNGWIFIASVVFYFVGSGYFTLILIASINFNYFLSKRFGSHHKKRDQQLLAIGITVNLLTLAYFKYMYFFANQIVLLGVSTKVNNFFLVALPIGISFYSFQAVSYLVDVYYRQVKPPQSIIDFGMYLACFPQLIAGPIVRYQEIQNKILGRTSTVEDVFHGLTRFVFGLAKKILVADTMGEIADHCFNMPATELGMATAWLGILAYTFQIYFDFSAYSDMAIGLGRCMGFDFPENFDNPYRATSITNFWQRWHMTLSRWFRDYLYIPLGGNRTGKFRTYINLFMVFFLCGLWHGAAYTFILWGIYHGVLLVLERISKGFFHNNPFGMFKWPLTFLLIMIGWTIFRADSLTQMNSYFYALFGGNGFVNDTINILELVNAKVIIISIVITYLIWFPKDKAFINHYLNLPVPQSCMTIVLLFLSLAFIAGNEYSPFIYFRF